MTFKRGKKETRAKTSYSHSAVMDKSTSVSRNSNFIPVASDDHPNSPVKVPHGRKPLIPPNNGIDRIMKCPVCCQSIFPPIYQCPGGHTLCSDCRLEVNEKCPVCRKEIGNIRCLALEKFALSFPLPCRYHSCGCTVILPYYSKVKHEDQCTFRPYTCPHPRLDCSVKGDVPSLVAHLRERHKVDLQLGSTFNHRYVKQDPCSVDNISWTLTLFHCFNHYFCLHFEAFRLGTEPVYIAFLRFMGEESEARKFGYCLEVGGDSRKLAWQGVPRSIRMHHHSVRDSYDGLIIQRSLALHFSGGDRKELKLRVTGRIWKDPL